MSAPKVNAADRHAEGNAKSGRPTAPVTADPGDEAQDANPGKDAEGTVNRMPSIGNRSDLMPSIGNRSDVK